MEFSLCFFCLNNIFFGFFFPHDKRSYLRRYEEDGIIFLVWLRLAGAFYRKGKKEEGEEEGRGGDLVVVRNSHLTTNAPMAFSFLLSNKSRKKS